MNENLSSKKPKGPGLTGSEAWKRTTQGPALQGIEGKGSRAQRETPRLGP